MKNGNNYSRFSNYVGHYSNALPGGVHFVTMRLCLQVKHIPYPKKRLLYAGIYPPQETPELVVINEECKFAKRAE